MKSKYLLMIPLLVGLSGSGCLRESPIIERNVPIANGYDIVVQYNNSSKSSAKLCIGKLNDRNVFTEYIHAIEKNGDERIDTISLIAPKGSPLEELASVEKLDKIFADFNRRHNK